MKYKKHSEASYISGWDLSTTTNIDDAENWEHSDMPGGYYVNGDKPVHMCEALRKIRFIESKNGTGLREGQIGSYQLTGTKIQSSKTNSSSGWLCKSVLYSDAGNVLCIYNHEGTDFLL